METRMTSNLTRSSRFQALSVLLALSLQSGLALASSAIPRSETPNPLQDRGTENTMILNGQWDFAYGEGGKATHQIMVPFAPESAASGIGNPEFEPNNDRV